MTPRFFSALITLSLLGAGTSTTSALAQSGRAVPDQTLASYFKSETAELTDSCLAEVQTQQDWEARKDEYRRQLREMLGLDPLPERTDLKPVITGRVEHEEFIVENLHFQSLPGLYVTANFYRPKEVQEKLPTILYVCGHGRVAKDNISFGNKTAYQHHGAWFARHGYTCLTIDTIQLGEIEGIHHGTYRYGMFWWNNRGYTPAGVEAWNCMRALDYLETRPEVDATRFGVTGRSGGGAYSWWSAALDERIKVAVPVAGITSLKNHVVDGCVEGHCDCMFMVNTYRWDFPQVAALVSPRPLLISNTDKDGIFPLDGVVDVHAKVRRIYELQGAGDKLGLQITEGPHKDTQELHIHAFIWFDRWLKGGVVPISRPAEKFFDPAQLRVLEQIPSDQRVTTIHESFVPTGNTSTSERLSFLTQLRQKVFRGWPAEDQEVPLHCTLTAARPLASGLVQEFAYDSEAPFRLKLFVIRAQDTTTPPARVIVRVPTQEEWNTYLSHPSLGGTEAPSKDSQTGLEKLLQQATEASAAIVLVAPRGAGPHSWNQADDRKLIQIRRRFMLLGQTLAGMQIYDLRRAIQAIRTQDDLLAAPLEIQAQGDQAVWSLYASLFEPSVNHLQLSHLPGSHENAPDLLNIARLCTFDELLAIVREQVTLSTNGDQ